MSFKPNQAQALLVWRLVFDYGQDGIEAKKAGPKVRGQLEREGLLEELTVRNPVTGKPRKRFRLTDKGWSWAEEHLDAKLHPNSKPAPTLQAVLTRLKSLLRSHDIRLAELVRSPSPEPPADPPTQVRTAYLSYTSGRLNESMPLDILRRALPELPRERVDQALLDLFRSGAGVLFPEDNTRQLTPALQDAAVRMSGDPKHYLKLER